MPVVRATNLFRRGEALQFLKPVLHERDLRYRRFGQTRLDHDQAAVGRDIDQA